MMIAIQRSAATGIQFDEEIDDIIKRAPTVTAEALAVALRVRLDVQNRYDVLFTRTLNAVAALPEPARSEACDLLVRMADPARQWSAHKASLDRLRGLTIDGAYLRPADRLVIAARVRADAAPAVQMAAE